MNNSFFKSRLSYKRWFFIMIASFISLTIGKFIPVYFTSQILKLVYNLTILMLLSVSAAIILPGQTSRLSQSRRLLTLLGRIITGLGIFSIGTICLFLGFLAIWQNAGVYYVLKSNPDVKIVTRYIDLGAGGGGTVPSDYETDIERPLTPLFKVVTSIDTNKIDKNNWKKPDR